MRMLFYLGIAVLIFWLGTLFWSWQSGGPTIINSVWRSDLAQRPLIFAHRGGGKLGPENTLQGIAAALALGVDGIEIDARLTQSGWLALMHDEQIDRVSDASGAFATLDDAAIAALSIEDGGRVPSLRSVFEQYAASRLLFIIEIKDSGERGKEAARKLAALIDEFAHTGLPQRVIIGAFPASALREFRRQAPKIATSAAFFEVVSELMRLYLGTLKPVMTPGPRFAALQIPSRFYGLNLAAPGLLARVRARGQAAHYWTINDLAEMDRLIDAGVDALITDYPERARQALHKAGYHTLPAAHSAN